MVPGGRSIPLNFHNRKDYVDAVTTFKLHEMDKQVLWLCRDDCITYKYMVLCRAYKKSLSPNEHLICYPEFLDYCSNVQYC